MGGCPLKLLPHLTVSWFVVMRGFVKCGTCLLAALWASGGQEPAGLAHQQISRNFHGARRTEGSVNICGMIKGCFWIAQGSREIKPGFSIPQHPPLNAIDLQDSQSEGVAPRDDLSNTNGTRVGV